MKVALDTTLTDLLGAISAIVIYASSIATFIARLYGRQRLGLLLGYPLLLTGCVLLYLLIVALGRPREVLYFAQVGLMLLWMIILLVLDYILKVDFRRNRAAVIAFVVLYFAGTGGMLGVAARAGSGWMAAAIPLFIAAGVLAFIQRRKTGL
jgi:hypothetical protein